MNEKCEDFDKLRAVTDEIYSVDPIEQLKRIELCNDELQHVNMLLSDKVRVLTDLLSNEHLAYIEACIQARENARSRDYLYDRLMSVKNILLHPDSTVRMSKEVRSTLEKIFNI